jgi:hypothetical protein
MRGVRVVTGLVVLYVIFAVVVGICDVVVAGTNLLVLGAALVLVIGVAIVAVGWGIRTRGLSVTSTASFVKPIGAVCSSLVIFEVKLVEVEITMCGLLPPL